MTLSELCNTTSNYIGQIEMGRRIPSFEKIEKIASALEIPAFSLFIYENDTEKGKKKLKTKDYIKKMSSDIKKEVVSRLTIGIKKEIDASFNPKNYK